jgi:hypothetical protein
MNTFGSKPVYLKPGCEPLHSTNQSLFSYDRTLIDFGGCFDPRSGCGFEPQVLAVSGFADTGVQIGLQGPSPTDTASIAISLDNVVNLAAFAKSDASGTATSTATNQGTLTLTKGVLSGTYTAAMSIDLTAYIAADHATVQMEVTDKFQLSLSGTGFTSVALATTASAGSAVVATSPGSSTAGGSLGNHGGTFDLATFAANVLNTAQWNIAFMAGPGETLSGVGTSVLTISAIEEVAGAQKPQISRFQEVERSTVAFQDPAPRYGYSPVPSFGPGPGGPFHGF